MSSTNQKKKTVLLLMIVYLLCIIFIYVKTMKFPLNGIAIGLGQLLGHGLWVYYVLGILSYIIPLIIGIILLSSKNITSNKTIATAMVIVCVVILILRITAPLVAQAPTHFRFFNVNLSKQPRWVMTLIFNWSFINGRELIQLTLFKFPKAFFSIIASYFLPCISTVLMGLAFFLLSKNTEQLPSVQLPQRKEEGEKMTDYNSTSEIAWLQFTKKKTQYENLTERDEAALFAQCVELQVLKAPATAIFPDFNEMVVNGSHGRYSVSGFVDSQNSYGAMIRSQYTYNVEKDSTGKWRCNNQFIDTETKIKKQVFGNAVLWWILGIIGTIITVAITYSQLSDLF